MPTFSFAEPGRPLFFGGYVAADAPAPNPITSPLVFDKLGNYVQRIPLTATGITVEQWGGGCGGTGRLTADTNGGRGGCGAGYTKYTLGEGLYVPGGDFTIYCAGGGNGGVPGSAGQGGGNTTVTFEGTLCSTAGGGKISAGGTATVVSHKGIVSVATTVGSVSVVPSTAAGTAGGAGAGPGGGAGGAGGAGGSVGSPGTGPGGGGGGAGGGADKYGGAGADGKVVITWV